MAKSNAEMQARYDKSEKGRAARKRWTASPEGKASQASRTERYWRNKLGVARLEASLRLIGVQYSHVEGLVKTVYFRGLSQEEYSELAARVEEIGRLCLPVEEPSP